MPIELIILLTATAVFIGGHFALSHAWRDRAIALLGPSGFRLFYSAVAGLSLVAALIAFRFAPRDPVLWSPGLIPQLAFDALTGLSLVLLAGSLFGNPALLGPVNGQASNGSASRADERTRLLGHLPHGVFEITRHPMMFGIALWAIAEIIIAPGPRQFVFFGGLAFLAIYGARSQDRKLAVLVGAPWQLWVERTPFWPDLRRIHAPGVLWLVALIAWLVVTWLHSHVGYAPVGIWLLEPGA